MRNNTIFITLTKHFTRLQFTLYKIHFTLYKIMYSSQCKIENKKITLTLFQLCNGFHEYNYKVFWPKIMKDWLFYKLNHSLPAFPMINAWDVSVAVSVASLQWAESPVIDLPFSIQALMQSNKIPYTKMKGFQWKHDFTYIFPRVGCSI